MSSFPPIIFSVGTTPVLLLSKKESRKQYIVVYPSTSKVAANTGIVYLGIGMVPTATGGNTSAGHIMQPGESFGESDSSPQNNIYDVSKEAIYAVASTSGQILEVYEVV